MITRSRLGFRSNRSLRTARPVRIGVAIPFSAHLSATDSERLDAIEDHLEAAVAGRAVVVCVITTPVCREFVLHGSASDRIPSFHAELQRDLAPNEVQMFAEIDADWALYGQITSAD